MRKTHQQGINSEHEIAEKATKRKYVNLQANRGSICEKALKIINPVRPNPKKKVGSTLPGQRSSNGSQMSMGRMDETP